MSFYPTRPEASADGEVTRFFRSRVPLLRAVSPETARALAAAATPRSYRAGEELCRAGEPAAEAWVLLEGRVSVNRSRWNGRRLGIELMVPGDFFGLPAVVSPAYPSDIRATRPSRVAAIPRRTLLDRIERDPTLLREILASLGQRVLFMQSLLLLAREPAQARMAAALLYLHRRFGPRLPLTRAEIGEMAGTTPETAMRVLARLEKRGLVRKSRGSVTVPDPGALRRDVLGRLNEDVEV